LGRPSPFGQLLRELRVRQGVSLTQLSRLTHYNKGYLSRVENGHRPPSAQLASRCDEVLGAAGELTARAAQDTAPGRGAVPHPAQLPPDVASFTGRDTAMAELDLLGADQAPLHAVSIAVITGLPGVGKTALAVHWARRAADRFTDGALYANMRGHDPAGVPARAADVLDGFLRALGAAPAMIPADVEGRSALLRTLLHRRRMLILLDNIATAEQVRPLLPGSPGSFVVVTSRNRLSGLVVRDGAHRVMLSPLTEEEAIRLLHEILGPDRVAAEPEAVAEVAHRCAYLPLALRIAADRASADPDLKLSQLVGQLAAERERLDTLATEDDMTTAVRAVFSWSYATLPAAAARMFRLLGLHAGPDFSVPAAAALTALPPDQATRLLDVLAGAHLLEEGGTGRYRFHDLLRIYASERAADDETEAERGAAISRSITWYLHTAEASGRVLMPVRRYPPLGPPPEHCGPLPFTSYEQALAWCDAEQPNLVAAIRHAARAGLHDSGWKLSVTLWAYFCLRRPADWITTARAGLAAARGTGDPKAEAWALNSLGTACFCLRLLDDALDCYLRALRVRREIGDRWGEGLTLNNLGELYWEFGRLDDALDCHQQALALFRGARDRHGEGITLDNLGATYRKLGRAADALSCLRQALDLFREAGDRRGEGMALHNLGETYYLLRRLVEAVTHYQQAILVHQQAGDRHGEAVTLRDLGNAFADAGQPGPARKSWRQALAIFEDLSDPQAAEVRASLVSQAPDE